MKTNRKMMVYMMAACAATMASAEGWRLSVGPAWRTRVKAEIRGTASVPSVPGSYTRTGYDRDPGAGDWTPGEVTERRPDPSPAAAPGDELWAVGASFTETTVTPDGGAAGVDATDTRAPLGLKARAGHDVWTAGDFSLALDLRLAGYWGVRADASGRGGGATTVTRTGTDWWLFTGGPYPDDRDFAYAPNPERDPSAPTTWGPETVTRTPGQAVRARLRADLYQVGLGPTVTWRAFPWLDAYAGAAALCSLAHLDFDAGASRASETRCRPGFAGELGLTARLTDGLGLFAEVGYEWIDRFGASADGLSARVDFSGLVVSAGLAASF